MTRIEYQNKVRQLLASLPLDDLYAALGRYCGPNNEFICVKKYGFPLTQKDVEEEIMERLLFMEDSDTIK